MGKIKNAIKVAYDWLNKTYQWLSLEGGMLHILGFATSMLTFTPIVGWVWASAITWAIAIGIEAIHFFSKRNTLKQCGNDIIRDAIGWGYGVIVVLLHTI